MEKSPDDVAPRLAEVQSAADRTPVDVRLRKLTQVYFALGRDSVPLIDDDYPAFLIADHVLAGHFHSRMYEALRHRTGQTYGVDSSVPFDTAPNLYLITSFTRLANRDTAERTMLEVLSEFHRDGIDTEERNAAAQHLLGRRAFFRQSPRQVLVRAMFERRLGLGAGFIDRLPERAAALSTEQINELIDRYFDPASFRLVRVAP